MEGRFPGDDCCKGLVPPPRCVEVAELRANNSPPVKARLQLVAGKQAMTLDVKHVEVGCTLHEDVDDCDAAFAHMCLKIRQRIERSWAIEEHQQSDRNHRIKVFVEPIVAKICQRRLHGQCFSGDSLLNVRDCSRARVQRKNGTAAFGSGEGEVAYAAAIVEHAAMQVGKGRQFKRIEPKVARSRLLLKLRVEELDATVGVHSSTSRLLPNLAGGRGHGLEDPLVAKLGCLAFGREFDPLIHQEFIEFRCVQDKPFLLVGVTLVTLCISTVFDQERFYSEIPAVDMNGSIGAFFGHCMVGDRLVFANASVAFAQKIP